MQRPRQHEIETLADNQFRSVLPPKWIVRDLDPDYGLDNDIEILTEDGQKVVNFRVQLKGSESLKPNSSGLVIKFRFLIKHARYFCKEVCTPVVVVLADIASKKTYWYAPQIDHDLQTRLNRSSNKRIMFHIPTRNVLPDTLRDLLKAVDNCSNFLSARGISEAKPHRFADPFPSGEELTRVIAGCQEKIDLLRLKSVMDLYEARKYDDAMKEAKAILDNVASSVEARFSAALQVGRVYNTLQPREGADILDNHSRVGWWIAGTLRDLTKRGPDRLRCWADIILCAARIHYLVGIDMYEFMNWQLNKEQSDPLWFMMLGQKRRDTTRRIARAYQQAIRFVRYALHIKAYEILPQCLGRIAYFMAHFIHRLWKEGLDEAAMEYRDSLKSLLTITVSIDRSLKTNLFLEVLIDAGVSMMRPNDAEDRKKTDTWIRQHIDQIENPSIREAMELRLNKSHASIEATMKPDGDNIGEEKQIYRGMAASFGVDLDDPNDRVAQIIRIGIEDLNPERVLKHCQHLFVKPWSTGMVGQWLHLPTAGFKALCCLKRNYMLAGLILDSTYGLLQAEMKCQECPDRQPHPDTWKWTRKWQREQDEIYRKKHPEQEGSSPPGV